MDKAEDYIMSSGFEKENSPDRHVILYRYRPVFIDEQNTWTNRDSALSSLTGKLYFSHPKDFNDLHDCKPQYAFSMDRPSSKVITQAIDRCVGPISNREYKHYQIRGARLFEDPNIRAQLKDTLKQSLQTLFDSASICCFAGRNDNYKMWSHYAHGHTGYCLGFELPKNWLYTNDNGESGKILIARVDYAEVPPIVDPYSDFYNDSVALNLVKVLLTKSTVWKEEGEFRAIRPDTKASFQAVPVDCLKEVIFGARMQSQVKKEIASFLKSKSYQGVFFQATSSDESYAVSIDQVSV